tara:strand:+ start:141 stop:743 length:603 start_codon:yes stop_codon:yes gene_type:complete
MALNFANNNSLSAITSLPTSISGGGMTLISTQTASSSSTISFTSGIDSTYKEYIFKLYDIHPTNDGVDMRVNFRDGGSSFDAIKTSSFFWAYQGEGDEAQVLQYSTGRDLAQSTSADALSGNIGADNDQSGVATLHLFDPSNTTFVKHYISISNVNEDGNYTINSFKAGYCNTTSAIDGVQFSMSSGTIQSGTIKMYGVS